MTEKLRQQTEGYKIWRQPASPEDPVVYMGEFYPPSEQAHFIQRDLENLGFPPGKYTVLIPAAVRKRYAVEKWQCVTVYKC
jgi:hypothetical protein